MPLKRRVKEMFSEGKLKFNMSINLQESKQPTSHRQKIPQNETKKLQKNPKKTSKKTKTKPKIKP